MTTSTSELVFVPLGSGLRRGLESSVVGARGVVEAGVGRVFDRLGVARVGDPFSLGVPVGLSDGERVLRRVVGVKVRQAGSFDAAVEEVAFGVWHRMLFARFLAENDLLMHPDSMCRCRWLIVRRWRVRGLVRTGGWWRRGLRLHMLPGLFPSDDPLSRVEFCRRICLRWSRFLMAFRLRCLRRMMGWGGCISFGSRWRRMW